MLDTVEAVEATNEITFPWRFSVCLQSAKQVISG